MLQFLEILDALRDFTDFLDGDFPVGGWEE